MRHYLDTLRVELWWREALVRLSRGVLAGVLLAVALIGVAVWSERPPEAYLPQAVVAFWGIASLALAVARRPTVLRAARQADRQRTLFNRLATATELLDGRISSQLAGLQLRDAAQVSASLSPRRAFPRSDVAARNAALLITAALVVFGVAITQLQSPVAVQVESAEAPAVQTEAMPEPTQVAAASPQQLQQLRARSATEQQALSLLADQLRKTAAARDIGQALQRGDVATAGAELNQLALNSDQLSQTAKLELAGALLNASKGTTNLDKSLAAAELAATQAMTRSNYQTARTALQNLSAAVINSQSGTLTQQQLVQQIQQLERDAAAQTGGNGTDCGVLTNDGEFFQDCSAAGQSTSSGAMGVVSRGSGQSPTAGVGEVAGGHGFATTGVDLDPLGQMATHVDLPAANVAVDLAPSNAQGNGVTSEPKAPTVAISQSSQQNAQQAGGPQSAQPVAEESERTIVSPAHRAAVRDFFQPTERP